MNILHKKLLVVSALMIGVSIFVISNKKSTVMNVLEHQQFVTEKLQKTISKLNDENRALKEELKISKQYPIILNSETALSLNRLAEESEIKINSDKNDLVEIPSVEEDYSTVDINAPFNGVDPLSDKQNKKYTEFKQDIDNYEFNERFDMQGFLSDPRFRELHASLGVKLQDYVDKKLEGVALMQDNPEGAKMLVEIDD